MRSAFSKPGLPGRSSTWATLRSAPGLLQAWRLPGGRDGVVARPELVADAVDLDGQSPFEHFETLAVSEVVVRGDLPAGRYLELGERPLAAGLLARLEEGGCVALDGVVDPPGAVVDGGRVHVGALPATVDHPGLAQTPPQSGI